MKQVERIDLGEINVSLGIGVSARVEAVIEKHKNGATVSKKTVSDLIGEDTIKTWNPGKIVMIVAGTDTGKSFFIRHRVFEYFRAQNKRILYLVPRLRIKEQFERSMCGEKGIVYMTYQAVEAIQNSPNSTFDKWDIIVCDEAHYFISDGAFNKQTDLSFDWVMEQQNAIRIFLTATGDGIDRYLNEERIEFEKVVLPLQSRQIKSLTFFNNESQIERIAEQVIADGGKGIFFLSRLEMAYSLSQKFKGNSLFLCSEHSKKYAKYMDKNAISKMIEAEHFECSLLFATSALDAGVSLKDRTLTTVVVDMLNPDTLIQCIGRKRIIDGMDSFDLYIHNYNNNRIGGKLISLKKDIRKVRILVDMGPEVYNAAHGRGNDGSGIIFDKPVLVNGEIYFEKAINKLKYAYTEQTIEAYHLILRNDVGYIRYVCGLLGMKKYSVMEETQKVQSLSSNLEKFVDKPMLTQEDKEPFIQIMGIGRKNSNRISRSYSVLAAWLESNRLSYRLIRYRTSRNDPDTGEKIEYNGAWKVIKISE